ncbi:MAG: RsmD family RNA methyltransferase [Candidatus Thermoplasmatota archaeon]|nr:RsmD family RNA methyltransferase [Candidatus Thermoplasmatota archaeon]
MNGLVLLTGEAPELALAELEGALDSMGQPVRVSYCRGQVVILDAPPPPGLAPRLGFSHFSGTVYEMTGASLDKIASGARSYMERTAPLSSLSWIVKVVGGGDGVLKPSDIFNTVEQQARDMGRMVRHRDPDITLFIIVHEEAFIGRVLETSSRTSAMSRRGSRMPFNRPVIMDPRLARVMVNLAGLPPGSTILDPFLGPAGLAIEAADLGLKVVGIEKDPRIHRGALSNIEHVGLSDMIIARNADSKMLRSYPWTGELPVFDGIITDPPFGRSAATHGQDTGALLSDVLVETAELVKEGAPLVIDAPDPEHIRKVPGYILKKELSLRIHKSMTRYIGVLERR